MIAFKSLLPFFPICFLCLLAGCEPNAQEYFEQARAQLKAGQPEKAISLLDEAVKKDSRFPDAFNARGAAYLQIEKYGKALANFDRAIELDSTDYRYFYNRGNAKRRLRNDAGAYQDYTKALSLADSHYEVYLNRALTLINQYKVEAALQDFAQAEKLSEGKDPAVFLYQGEALLRQEAYQPALVAFKRCLQRNPKEGRAYLGMATAQFALEEKAAACQNLGKAETLGIAQAAELKALRCNNQPPNQ